MANLSDLRYIVGIGYYDFGTNDTIYGTAEDDSVQLHRGNDVFIDISGGNDVVTDWIAGGGFSGNDVISTGLGDDVVKSDLDAQNEYYGGLGRDHLHLVDADSGVRVDLASGTGQTVAIGLVSRIVGFETVTGSFFDDVLYGDAEVNTLLGAAGDDLIDGRAGNDKVLGADGDDRVFGGAGGDEVTGDAGDDQVYGDSGVDLVNGGQGNDRVSGGADDDYLFGMDGNDTMFGDAGWDDMNGGTGNDVMFGGTGRDTMKGGTGNDRLEGGASLDGLTGNAGSDRFVFRAPSDSGPGGEVDIIFDFQRGLDKIDVSLIDARATQAGNQAFSFVAGGGNFTAAGQIKAVYVASRDVTVVKFNTDNDSSPEMQIDVVGKIAFAAGDFIL